MAKKVAIIVLVYNGRQYLPDCLFSLRKISYPKDLYKVVAVDNNSSDSSAKYIRNNFPEVTVIENEKNLGFAAGNNVGVKYALESGFDYVHFLNQDTVVDADFLQEAVVAAEKEEKIACVQSKLLYFSDKSKLNSRGNVIHYLGFGWTDGNLETDNGLTDTEIAYASGCSCLWKISALREIGLFDEKFFMYHEDLDLSWRARLLGYKILLASKSAVYHKYEFSRSISKYYFMEKNRYIVMLQNYKWPTLFLIGPAVDLMELGLFLFSLKSGWWKEKIKVYRYLIGRKNLEEIFTTREKIQKQRKVGDKEISRLFTGKIEFQELPSPILKYIANPLFNLYWQIVKRLIWW